MKKIHQILSLLALIMLVICLDRSVSAEEIKIKEDVITLAFDDKGNSQYQEEVHYIIDGEVKSLQHKVGLGKQGDVNEIHLRMKAKGQNNAFPFAQTDQHAIGTFQTKEQIESLAITSYNHMSDSEQIATYQGHFRGLWVNYGNEALFDVMLFQAPYAIQSATLKLSLPKNVDKKQFELLLQNDPKFEWSWQDDSTILAEMGPLKAGENVHVQMHLPATVMASNKVQGPSSQGKEILKDWQEKVKAAKKAYQRQRWLLYGSFLALCLLSLVLIALVLHEKFRLRKLIASDSLDLDECLSTEPLYALLAIKACRLKNDKHWVTGLLAALLAEGAVGIDQGDWVYPLSSESGRILGEAGRVTWGYLHEIGGLSLDRSGNRKQVNALKRRLKQAYRQFRKKHIQISGRGRLYQFLNLLLCLIWVGLGFYWFKLWWGMHESIYFWLAYLALGFVLFIMMRKLFPIYMGGTIGQLALIRADLKMSRKRHLPEGLSALDMEQPYLYSVFCGHDASCAKAIRRSGIPMPLIEEVEIVKRLMEKKQEEEADQAYDE